MDVSYLLIIGLFFSLQSLQILYACDQLDTDFLTFNAKRQTSKEEEAVKSAIISQLQNQEGQKYKSKLSDYMSKIGLSVPNKEALFDYLWASNIMHEINPTDTTFTSQITTYISTLGENTKKSLETRNKLIESWSAQDPWNIPGWRGQYEYGFSLITLEKGGRKRDYVLPLTAGALGVGTLGALGGLGVGALGGKFGGKTGAGMGIAAGLITSLITKLNRQSLLFWQSPPPIKNNFGRVIREFSQNFSNINIILKVGNLMDLKARFQTVITQINDQLALIISNLTSYSDNIRVEVVNSMNKKFASQKPEASVEVFIIAKVIEWITKNKEMIERIFNLKGNRY
jgi:hypothetical protein